MGRGVALALDAAWDGRHSLLCVPLSYVRGPFVALLLALFVSSSLSTRLFHLGMHPSVAKAALSFGRY